MFIVFRKIGGFYHVFDGDSYILNYLFNYKIVGNRVGFPINVNIETDKNVKVKI